MRAGHLLAGLLAAALALVPPATARAHATLVGADPPIGAVLASGPERLVLWFSEPLEPAFSEVQVLDTGGRRVDLGDSRVLGGDGSSLAVSLPSLEPGTYTVAWRVLSAMDGHVTQGVYTLAVGVEPAGEAVVSATVSERLPLEVAVRWQGYLSAAALFGAALAWLVVLRPAATDAGVAGPALPAAQPPLRRLLFTAWLLLLAGTLQAMALQLAAVLAGGEGADVPASAARLLFGARFGAVWLLRLGLVLLLAVALARLVRGDDRRSAWAVGGLGAAVLFTTSLNSHAAATTSPAGVAVLVDWLHLAAASAWVGGLLSLVLVLPSGLNALPAVDRWRVLSRLVPRFSVLAGASVATLVITGVYQTWLLVGSAEALGETLSGRSLLVKLALVGLLLLLGATNLLYIRPRLAAAAESRTPGRGTRFGRPRPGEAVTPPERPPSLSQRPSAVDRRRLSYPGPSSVSLRFRRLVRAEALLALLVLGVTAVLTSLPPARQSLEHVRATRPLTVAARATDAQLTLTIAPAKPGAATYTVLLRRPDGRPLDRIERVTLRFTPLDRGLGAQVVTAQPIGDGHFLARGAFIGVVGRWQVEVTARWREREDVGATFRLRVAEGGIEVDEPAPGQEPSPAVPPDAALAALALAALGIGLGVFAWRGLGMRSMEGGITFAAGVVVLALGGYVALQAAVVRPDRQDFGATSALAAPEAAQSWREVARWRNAGFFTTEPFSVRSPWRIRWRLENADEPLVLMLTAEDGVTVLRLLTAEPGVTSGSFEQATGGTYTLMFHNNSPHAVVVEERAAP